MLDNKENISNGNEIDSTPNQPEEKIEKKEETISAIEKKSIVVTSNKAVDEIEGKVAEDAETDKVEAVKMKEYKNFSLEELVDELRNLIKENPIQSINDNVNKIKTVFNVKFGEILKKEKEKFISEGGDRKSTR